MKIKTLNQEVINQIAAGEVIIQPASIVKELIENSIDAKATKIDIKVKDGGKKEIIISDNGIGISYDDIPLAFKRHATSKINYLSDLETLSTMGFRGEALSSIASVANVEIITRAQDEELGSKTDISDGKILERTVYPFEGGTTIIVSDLFANIPARYKFLKSEQKEEAAIRDIVEKLALANPNISFSYINNDQKVFKTSGNNNLKDTAYIIFGSNFSKHLTPFQIENLPMKITGLIGDLDARRTYRDNQIFFINGRYVKSPILSKAYEEVWQGKLMKHQYPSGIIFVELPPNMIDVNVHPQKTEINILNKTLITLLFKQCMRQVLEDLDLIPRFLENEEEFEAKQTIDPSQIKEISTTQEKFKIPQNINNQNHTNKESNSNKTLIPKIEIKDRLENSNQNNTLDLENFRLIGVLFNTYILLENENDFYIIDQHAAHEAVLYEEFSKILTSIKSFEAQRILPVKVDTTKKELESFKTKKDLLSKYGFEAEIVDETLLVKAVPLILNNPQSPELIIDLISYLDNYSENKPDLGLDKIITRACKTAIKGGNSLRTEEIEQLLKNLSRLNNPYTCPHGRPVIQKRSQYEIEKLFKRVV